MMCGLMNPTINPNPLVHGNPRHYHSPTLQPLIYCGTSSKEDQHHYRAEESLPNYVQASVASQQQCFSI